MLKRGVGVPVLDHGMSKHDITTDLEAVSSPSDYLGLRSPWETCVKLDKSQTSMVVVNV